MKVLCRQMVSPWTWHCPLHIPPTPLMVRNQTWTHQPLCAESRESIVAKSNPLGDSLSNWTHQDVNRFSWGSAKSHVSFHSLPRRFVVVTLHSADVTNPSILPQEPRISFATFGIRRRVSLSLNPFQIISPSSLFLCIPLPFSSPCISVFFDWFRWLYIIHRGPGSKRLNCRHFLIELLLIIDHRLHALPVDAAHHSSNFHKHGLIFFHV